MSVPTTFPLNSEACGTNSTAFMSYFSAFALVCLAFMSVASEFE